MSVENTTPPAPAVPASGGDPATPSGDGTGTPAPGSAAPAVDPKDATIRSLQSERDKLRSELEKRTPATPSPTPTAPAGEEPLTRSALFSVLGQYGAITQEATQSQADFPNADPAIFARSHEFETPAALRAAAQSSHASFQARLDALGVIPKADHEAALAAAAAGKPLGATTPPGTQGGTGTATPPTWAEVRVMTPTQLDAVDAQFGAGTCDGIYRKAMNPTG